jgi:hypothetical protein
MIILIKFHTNSEFRINLNPFRSERSPEKFNVR